MFPITSIKKRKMRSSKKKCIDLLTGWTPESMRRDANVELFKKWFMKGFGKSEAMLSGSMNEEYVLRHIPEFMARHGYELTEVHELGLLARRVCIYLCDLFSCVYLCALGYGNSAIKDRYYT